MNKNTKKLLILGGVILAIIILIIADKSFKERQNQENELSQNNLETLDDNALENELVKDDAADEQKYEQEESGKSDEADKSDKSDDAGNDNKDETTAEQQYSYEHWLAAGAVTGISMYYMDFELEGIYLASETPLGNHNDSKGVYVVFKSGGETITLRSVPLAEERSYPGTIDLSTENFGFATFDVVEEKDSQLKECEEVRLENLSGLINQLMLVTLYEH